MIGGGIFIVWIAAMIYGGQKDASDARWRVMAVVAIGAVTTGFVVAPQVFNS